MGKESLSFENDDKISINTKNGKFESSGTGKKNHS